MVDVSSDDESTDVIEMCDASQEDNMSNTSDEEVYAQPVLPNIGTTK